jgi:hypothetical protein
MLWRPTAMSCEAGDYMLYEDQWQDVTMALSEHI